MATYKELHGTDIEVVTSDPSNPVVGQVWYNTTTEQLKTQRQFLGNAWSSGGNLNTARWSLSGAGSQTSSLAIGGASNGDAGVTTEAYNGSSWTAVNDLNTARNNSGAAGVNNTAALTFGGNEPNLNNTEVWNGTNWTEVNNLNTARRQLGGAGTSTSALGIGGDRKSVV
mgnify:CR=1 FL=1